MMSVVMVATVPGMDEAGFAGLQEILDEHIGHQTGFRSHASGPTEGGWRVVEEWKSEANWRSWFDSYIKPSIAEGAPEPQIELFEISIEA